MVQRGSKSCTAVDHPLSLTFCLLGTPSKPSMEELAKMVNKQCEGLPNDGNHTVDISTDECSGCGGVCLLWMMESKISLAFLILMILL